MNFDVIAKKVCSRNDHTDNTRLKLAGNQFVRSLASTQVGDGGGKCYSHLQNLNETFSGAFSFHVCTMQI